MHRLGRVSALGLSLGLVLAACRGDFNEECEAGSRGCECLAAGGCDSGLSCIDGLCVDDGGGETMAGTESSTTSSGDGDGDSGDGDGDTGDGDSGDGDGDSGDGDGDTGDGDSGDGDGDPDPFDAGDATITYDESWTVTIPENDSSPVFVDGTLYLLAGQTGSRIIYRLDTSPVPTFTPVSSPGAIGGLTYDGTDLIVERYSGCENTTNASPCLSKVTEDGSKIADSEQLPGFAGGFATGFVDGRYWKIDVDGCHGWFGYDFDQTFSVQSWCLPDNTYIQGTHSPDHLLTYTCEISTCTVQDSPTITVWNTDGIQVSTHIFEPAPNASGSEENIAYDPVNRRLVVFHFDGLDWYDVTSGP